MVLADFADAPGCVLMQITSLVRPDSLAMIGSGSLTWCGGDAFLVSVGRWWINNGEN